MRTRLLILLSAAALAVAGAACSDGGNDGDDAGDSTPLATRTSGSPAAVESPTTEAARTPAATLPPREPGAAFDEEAARALLNVVLIGPSDLDAATGWTIQSDNTVDNAAAAAADPEQADSIERCGRLLSRTVANFPSDVVSAFLGGETLSFFSTATVFRDDAGAAVCAEEAATRLAEPGVLARQFGSVFVDPLGVTVAPVAYDTVGDASFAATLTGQTNAGGQVLDLTILVVGFRKGNVSAAVGSARSGMTPPTEELKPLVDLVLERIEQSQ